MCQIEFLCMFWISNFGETYLKPIMLWLLQYSFMCFQGQGHCISLLYILGTRETMRKGEQTMQGKRIDKHVFNTCQRYIFLMENL